MSCPCPFKVFLASGCNFTDIFEFEADSAVPMVKWNGEQKHLDETAVVIENIQVSGNQGAQERYAI